MHASGDGHGPSLRPEIAPPHACRAAAFFFFATDFFATDVANEVIR